MDNTEYATKRCDEVAHRSIRLAANAPYDRGYADYTRQPLPTKAARACVQCLMDCHDIGNVLRELDGFERISLVEQWGDYIEENATEDAVQLILDWQKEIVAGDVSVDNGQVYRKRWVFKISEKVDADILETMTQMLTDIIKRVHDYDSTGQ